MKTVFTILFERLDSQHLNVAMIEGLETTAYQVVHSPEEAIESAKAAFMLWLEKMRKVLKNNEETETEPRTAEEWELILSKLEKKKDH